MPEPATETTELVLRVTMRTGEVYETTIRQTPALCGRGPSLIHQYLNAFVDSAARQLRSTRLETLTRKIAST